MRDQAWKVSQSSSQGITPKKASSLPWLALAIICKFNSCVLDYKRFFSLSRSTKTWWLTTSISTSTLVRGRNCSSIVLPCSSDPLVMSRAMRGSTNDSLCVIRTAFQSMKKINSQVNGLVLVKVRRNKTTITRRIFILPGKSSNKWF